MSLTLYTDDFFMKEALKEAQKAYDKDEIPIGAVVVCNNQIISRAHNLTEQLIDVTAHAEMQAFTAASSYLGGKYLDECILYVTIEPCLMCAGAAYWTQLKKIVYGAGDEKRGYSTLNKKVLHPNTEVVSGVLAEESALIMRKFFEQRRSDH